MKITKEWLKKNQACFEAISEFNTYRGDKNLIPILKEMIVRNKLDWANWLIVRNMKYKQYVAYACFAAKEVLELYEKKYPEDLWPHQAIEAAEKCIKDPSKKNKAAAGAAARDAAGAAARAAAWAAAGAAARAAAWDAAWAAMLKKILLNGIILLED